MKNIKISIAMKKRFINKENHPMFGKHHTQKSKLIIGQKSKAKWENPTKKMIEGNKKQADTKKKLYREGKLVAWSKGLRGIKTKPNGIPAWNKGLKGIYKDSEETKRKKAKAFLGKKHSMETIKRLSDMKKGSNNPAWKGGITPGYLLERRSLRNRLWRESVFGRDNYICQISGEKGNLNANHIKRFVDHLNLRYEINNGITLSKNCHTGLVNNHELEWESYFNFNLETRGFLESEFIPIYLDEKGKRL